MGAHREILNRWVAEGGMPPDEWLFTAGEAPAPVQRDPNQSPNITLQYRGQWEWGLSLAPSPTCSPPFLGAER